MHSAAISTVLANISLGDRADILSAVLWGFIFLWLFWFGGSVGSFMNVVVYRLPAGLNLVHPGSRCPNCLHAIRWYHNLPILGWLILRGRCRDCASPISARYPLVETLLASLFVTLAAVEVLGEGANLPGLARRTTASSLSGTSPVAKPQARRAHSTGSFSPRLRHPIADMPERLWGLYAFQLVLCCTMLSAALIEYDRKNVPALLFAPALVAGLVAPLVWPELRPVPLSPEFSAVSWARGLAEGSAGLMIGGLFGLVVYCARAIGSRNRIVLPGQPKGTTHLADGLEVILPPALCGLFLGWQGAVGIAVLAACLQAFCAVAAKVSAALRAWRWNVCITLAAIAFLFAWGPFTEVAPWFGPAAGLVSIPMALVVVAVAALATACFAPYTEIPASPGDAKVPNPQENLKAILNSPTYRLAEVDTEFLARPELRPVRMQLELLKPQMALEEHGILSTVVVFGGTSIVERDEAERRLNLAKEDVANSPDDPAARRGLQRAERVLAKARYYDEAREFARLVSSCCQIDGKCDYAIITGGGPGIMEAANRGAYDAGAKSIGLNITLPAEQAPNPYITPELCFQFHYFALRKMHFLMRAKALVVFPGGFGTLDELTDALTLRQTQRMQAIPIIMYGREYWEHVIDVQFLADEGVIADEHLKLIDYADTPEEAWRIIATYHKHA